ncbi:MAG: hypothetical protein ACT4QE_14015, partial [Anaerolineales bacterium]
YSGSSHAVGERERHVLATEQIVTQSKIPLPITLFVAVINRTGFSPLAIVLRVIAALEVAAIVWLMRGARLTPAVANKA